ncbi:MAG: hypothetical protein V3S39_04690, partial [Thermodesulfobacteriota bacterium]
MLKTFFRFPGKREPEKANNSSGIYNTQYITSIILFFLNRFLLFPGALYVTQNQKWKERYWQNM